MFLTSCGVPQLAHGSNKWIPGSWGPAVRGVEIPGRLPDGDNRQFWPRQAVARLLGMVVLAGTVFR